MLIGINKARVGCGIVRQYAIRGFLVKPLINGGGSRSVKGLTG